MHIEISVIIAVYNAQNYIQKCIESVLSQSYCNFELIIVSDGSTDCTDKIILEKATKDLRIKYIKIPKSGVTNARKVGIQHALGSYLFFLDSDDTLPLYALNNLMTFPYRNQVDIIIGDYYEINVNGKVSVYEFDSQKTIVDGNQYIPRLLISKNQSIWGKLFNSRLFTTDLVHPIGIEYGEDFNLLIQLLSRAKKIGFAPIPIYNYTKRLSSLTTGKKDYDFLNYKRILFLDSIIDNLPINQALKDSLIIEVILNLYPAIKRMNYTILKEIHETLFKRMKNIGISRKLRLLNSKKWILIKLYFINPYIFQKVFVHYSKLKLVTLK